MLKGVNYARGWVRLQAQGAFPERLLNLLAQHSVLFWGVERLDEQTVELCVLRRDLRRARHQAGQAECTLQVQRRVGLPDFFTRFRTRYAFLAGLGLSVLGVCMLSNFVLTMDVTGNEQVPDAVILSELRRQGLSPGVYGPGLDTRQIELETLLALDELSWISVNLNGVRAQVVVREKIQPPVLLEEEEKTDIRARAGGIVQRVDTVSGQAVVKPGDTVGEGELLISATVTMEGPQYSDIPPRYLHVGAAGRVYARTWRTLSASIPLTAAVKEYTGQENSRWSLTFFDRRMNFYAKSSISWPRYDKISKTESLRIPGGGVLPFALTRERYVRWEPVTVQVDAQAAQQLLEQRLEHILQEQLGTDGSVVTIDWSARIHNDVLTVTAVAECEEQIGVKARSE